jgi:multidrug efflux pump
MTQLGVPSTVRGSFAGTAQVFQETMNSQVILILAAIATVYIVLGVLYESYVHPLTILSTLPSAGVGRCWRWSCSARRSALSRSSGSCY